MGKNQRNLLGETLVVLTTGVLMGAMAYEHVQLWRSRQPKYFYGVVTNEERIFDSEGVLNDYSVDVKTPLGTRKVFTINPKLSKSLDDLLEPGTRVKVRYYYDFPNLGVYEPDDVTVD